LLQMQQHTIPDAILDCSSRSQNELDRVAAERIVLTPMRLSGGRAQ